MRLLASAAKLGEPKAAYNLALLYLDGQTLPQDIKRSAELLRQAADAGNPEAQYALATFYKEGTGVEKDPEKAARLLQAAALADNVDAEVEYAIALFNGTGTPRNQPAAVALLRKAARQNSPIAQNRLAFVLIKGMGVPMDKVEGFKWHLVAKTAGKGDPELDAEFAKLSPEDRAKAEALAHRWLGDKLDAPAPKGQPVPQAPAAPQPVPFLNDLPSDAEALNETMLHSALINVMVKAARRAGRSLKRDLGEIEHLQVSLKGPANFVSLADKRAEEMLYTDLSKARPGYGFLGEEGGTREGADKSHTWIVDPLDGTTNFLHGIPQFAISIGLKREDTIIAGVIYNPANEELYIAERGKGAFLNDQRLRVAGRRKLNECVIACGLPHIGRGDHEQSRREMAELQNKVAGLRRFGAAALDLAFVAAGRLDGYWERNLQPWDIAAGQIMVREAGGIVSGRGRARQRADDGQCGGRQ